MHPFGAFAMLCSFSRAIFRAACVAVFVARLATIPQFLDAQAPGQWAWTGGSNLRGDDLGVYGNEYQFSAANIPGYRSGAVTWVGTDGRLWLLGGQGNNSVGWGGILNDLWVFEPAQGAHGEWAWMGGDKTYPPNIYGKPGVYGTEYEPAAANIPGSRSQAATWADTKGRLWLFGGEGIDSAGNQGELNDLWVFDSALGTHGEWAWMGGSSTIPTESDCMVHYLLRYPCGPMSTYGNKYQFGAANIPGGRTSAASWTDQTGRL